MKPVDNIAVLNAAAEVRATYTAKLHAAALVQEAEAKLAIARQHFHAKQEAHGEAKTVLWHAATGTEPRVDSKLEAAS